MLLTLLLWLAVASAAICLLNCAANLVALRDLPDELPPQRDRPLVSICVPARDEERDVESAVRSHLAQQGVPVEVVVVDDRSTDRTGEILDRLAAADPRLRVLRPGDPPEGWIGKSAALAAAVREARGEWFLFVDADVRLSPAAAAAGLAEAERTSADLLALLPTFELCTFGEKTVLPFLGDAVAYLLPSWLANTRRPRRFAAGGGAYMLVRREAYERFGGHGAIRDRVIDDVGLAIHAKKSGARTRMALGTRLVRVRMYRGFGEILRGFSKNLYVALDHSPLQLLAATGFVVVTMLLPAGVLLSAAAGLPGPRDLALAAASAGGFLACRLAADVRLRRDPLFAFTLPLMGAGLVLLLWYAAIRWHRSGVVEWRGRSYPRSVRR